ncbi:MAG TPA: GNAT family N-acetyltransferase [Candidatus Binatia bacterium]|nr:GNAT family N-acetyltransferase [Candidatus Binatia bacterium]
MSLEVRPALPDDLPAILELYEQLAGGLGHHPAGLEAARAALAEMATQPGRVLLTALLDGAVAGTADLLIVRPNITHFGQPWAIVEHVVVDRAARRRGVGRRLMEETVRRAREAGCYRLQLLSHVRRTDAHAFYRAVGFEPSAQGFRVYFP